MTAKAQTAIANLEEPGVVDRHAHLAGDGDQDIQIVRGERLFAVARVELKDAEVKVAHQLIEALAGDFEPEKYHDTFEENVKMLIKARLEGEEVTPVEKPKKMVPVVDLMAALKESLAQLPKKPPQRVEDAQRASEVKVAAKAKKSSRKKSAA